ncbi:Stress related protein [Corynebacterium pseudotuberculosis]|nr:Stress related protein [Corynebacterium pseudotuberculosis 267]AJC13675.1 Stress related protein [Corynebacterium pseudotuberculosis]AKC73698.1 universal stress protein [Corynebacterium pseudotuberculosis]AKJ55611.1 Stress related protein [Corynebacterium pseudotuberculosis]ALM78258.1 Stress related protein [Corynebacterium pseudotuberculosis]
MAHLAASPITRFAGCALRRIFEMNYRKVLMSDYSTIVVGTDGSKSSMLAVERAAKIAAALDSTLVIGGAYYQSKEEASKTLRQDSVAVLGTDPAQKNLEVAAEHAKSFGVTKVETKVHPGTPVEALMEIVRETHAELLVVGNRGINSLTGRLLGSVPADVARQSDCDVMIVHTVN